MPVMLNVAIMLLVAVAFNYPFAWRRYPAAWITPKNAAQVPTGDLPVSADFDFALREVGSLIDVSRADLAKIFRLAHKHATRRSLEILAVDNFYSHGAGEGAETVCQVLALDGDSVHYRIVAGDGAGGAGTMSRADFMVWRKAEVIHTGGKWQQLLPADERNG
jgi:CBS-domain-containing membrane protein